MGKISYVTAKKPKIVFVLNAITITRCLKRVEEFINEGYEVDVYGFERGGEVYARSTSFDITVLGHHEISQGYLTRMSIILGSLRNLFKKYQGKDVLYYYFFFDVAFCARLINRKRFIYEESDMPYTNISNGLIRSLLSWIDKRIICDSVVTIMTSEGFIDYHFGNVRPKNVIVVPNRVNPALLSLPYKERRTDINHLSIGFVGGFRYRSILNFAEVVIKRFPQFDFHVFGNINQYGEVCERISREFTNFHLHGKFRNPEELPSVYEQLDLVLATYDATSINAQYAEPNKMYESIFFHTPIIVSRGTFLEKKVLKLGIGYAVDATNEEDVVNLLEGLTLKDIEQKRFNAKILPKGYAVNENPELFELLENTLIS